MNDSQRPPPGVGGEALLRYSAIAEVEGLILGGWPPGAAVRRVASREHAAPDGRPVRISVRTLQRWRTAYAAGGIDALQPRSRSRTETSVVLSQALVHRGQTMYYGKIPIQHLRVLTVHRRHQRTVPQSGDLAWHGVRVKVRLHILPRLFTVLFQRRAAGERCRTCAVPALLVNGNRKLRILGNRKLRTFMRVPWRAAVTSAVGVDRVLGWAAGAERPERRPRTSPCPLGPVAITALFAGQGLPAPAMPPWIGEDSDGHASGSCCRGC